MTPRLTLAAVTALSLLHGCEPRSGDPDGRPLEGPLLVALGTAQDGGLPHAACRCDHCDAARSTPGRARAISSLGLVVPQHGVHLIDVTPDIRLQLDALEELREAPTDRVDRSPVDGVFLTHAHWGHYAGLGFFGFESVHTRSLPVHATEQLGAFLTENAPWSQLVALENIELRPLAEGSVVEIGAVRVSPRSVPHRDEYADTVGYLFEHGERSVLYVPDTDGWQHWSPPIEEVLQAVDVAILDGTFFSAGELPGREVSSIGHPLIRDTMDRLQPLVDGGSLTVYLTHLNHSNPALDPAGPERREIEERGFHVLEDGQRIGL